MPTPDRAYTPPRARPVTMNGLKSSQLGSRGALTTVSCALPSLSIVADLR